MMGFLIMMLGCFVMVGLVIAFIVCSVTKVKFRKILFFAPVAMWAMGIFVGVATADTEPIYTVDATVSPPDSGQNTIQTVAATETAVTETETGIVEPTTVAETTSLESEEEFRESCQKIAYKALLRTPDDYIGQRIVITAEVKQIMDGGWFDDSKYYRVQTDNDGGDWYMDDEYYMYDGRAEGNIKVLRDDVIKIYAEFIGLEEIRRALTGTKEEVPAIRAHYVDLISE